MKAGKKEMKYRRRKKKERKKCCKEDELGKLTRRNIYFFKVETDIR